MHLTNDTYVIRMGTRTFTERYFRDEDGWAKVSARGRTFRMTAEQVLNHLLPAQSLKQRMGPVALAAVAVTLNDILGAVYFCRETVIFEVAVVVTKAHGAAGVFFALLTGHSVND